MLERKLDGFMSTVSPKGSLCPSVRPPVAFESEETPAGSIRLTVYRPP